MLFYLAFSICHKTLHIPYPAVHITVAKTLFILLVQHGASLLRYQRSIAPRAHGKTGEVLGKLRQIADCGSFIDKPGARSLGAAAREDERQDKNDGKGVA